MQHFVTSFPSKVETSNCVINWTRVYGKSAGTSLWTNNTPQRHSSSSESDTSFLQLKPPEPQDVTLFEKWVPCECNQLRTSWGDHPGFTVGAEADPNVRGWRGAGHREREKQEQRSGEQQKEEKAQLRNLWAPNRQKGNRCGTESLPEPNVFICLPAPGSGREHIAPVLDTSLWWLSR